VLEIFQHQQRTVSGKPRLKALTERSFALITKPERAGKSGDDVRWILNRRERHNPNATLKERPQHSGDLQREARLANTTRPGECQQMDVRPLQERRNLRHVALASDEWRWG
jgi:hypothetical protein